MIQIFFFISMIALAALLLNLLWYLEDSRKEENAFYRGIHRAKQLSRTPASSALPVRGNGIPRHGTAYAKYEKAFFTESCRPVHSAQARFYEIGTSEEVPSSHSFSENQSKSA